MPTSKVIYTTNLRTESVHQKSQVKVISDAPIDNQGKGEAFSPTDFCASSLAMCMLTIAGIHTQKTDYTIDGSFAEVEKVMASAPRRISEININLTFVCSKELSNLEKQELENKALNCPVSHSLNPNIKQNCRFSYT